MTEAAPATPATEEAEIANPVSENPAIARCLDAYMRTYKAAMRRGKGNSLATIGADTAFRTAMPSLTGHENIRDFVACVAHGMLMGVIRGPEAARLLYAAQVATVTARSLPAPPKPAA